MNCVARNAGAPHRHRWLAWLMAVLLAASAAHPLHAAEMRLLHANPTTVRQVLLDPDDGVADADEATVEVQFESSGQRHVLHLRPNRELGAAAPLTGALAYHGKLAGNARSWAAVTRIGERWSGLWFDGADYFGIDAAGELGLEPQPADESTLMVYRLRDVVWDEEPSLEDDVRVAPPEDGARLAVELPTAVLPPRAPTHRLELAAVADALLEERYGPGLEAALLAQLNVIDGVFANQLGVRIAATSFTVFTRRADEPFSRTTDAEDLLDELSRWRNITPLQRQAGLTHLFTGRDLNGRTVGMAYLNALCGRRFSTSLSQSTGPTSFAALVAAHEIAHVFGAPHDGDTRRACADAPAGYLMSPRISGSQEFSSCSLEQMAPQLGAASCLAVLPPERPEPVELPEKQGGSGRLEAAWLALLAAMAASLARRRVQDQMRANQSARTSLT